MLRLAAALVAVVTTGLLALLLVLALALTGGVFWRRSNGRMRGPRTAGVSRIMPQAGSAGSPQRAAGPVLTAQQLGQGLGERATLLQFSSAFCAPCRATRRILADVAAMTEGVSYIEVDAESHLGLVRELNVLRTPTVLVLAADGHIVRRASGQPRKPDVIAALGVAMRVSAEDDAAEQATAAGTTPFPATMSINKTEKQDSDSSIQRA